MPDTTNWARVWSELRNNLTKQPPCPDHTTHPHVRTLSQRVINDVLDVGEAGIRVRSHRTFHEDFIEAGRFKTWWDHLTSRGTASLIPGNPNNPHPWRACIVGAVLATCLPDRIRAVNSNTIELSSPKRRL